MVRRAGWLLKGPAERECAQFGAYTVNVCCRVNVHYPVTLLYLVFGLWAEAVVSPWPWRYVCVGYGVLSRRASSLRAECGHVRARHFEVVCVCSVVVVVVGLWRAACLVRVVLFGHAQCFVWVWCTRVCCVSCSSWQLRQLRILVAKSISCRTQSPEPEPAAACG